MLGFVGEVVMLEANQIRERLSKALEGNEPFSDFEEWLSQESASLRFSDNALLDLVDSILSPLQVYFDRLISESALRNEIEIVLNPSNTLEQEVEFVFPNVIQPSAKPSVRPSRNSSVQLSYG